MGTYGVRNGWFGDGWFYKEDSNPRNILWDDEIKIAILQFFEAYNSHIDNSEIRRELLDWVFAGEVAIVKSRIKQLEGTNNELDDETYNAFLKLASCVENRVNEMRLLETNT